MSYAEIAAKGPSQTAEEVSILRAPAVPELEHTTDDSTISLIDVDSPHVSSVPSDFESQTIKTSTQADRIDREEEDKATRARAKAEEEKEKAKAKAKRAGQFARDNQDNPVILGNGIAVTAIGLGLGIGAYRKYTAGELTWKVVGAWVGVVGLFAAGDYYLSKYLFKKYPAKK